jgi:hypothetical protein
VKYAKLEKPNIACFHSYVGSMSKIMMMIIIITATIIIGHEYKRGAMGVKIGGRGNG